MKIKILLVLIVVYPLFFLFQGGDLTDVGFHSTNYRFFKDFLNDGKFDFLMVALTNFIGYYWLLLFPSAGILGLKLLYLFFLYGTLYLSWLILKLYSNNSAVILFGLFFGEVFVTRYTPFVFSYDIASWFFLTFSILFFLNSFKKESLFFAFLSGGFIALAALCRTPSIASISIGLLYFTSGNVMSRKKKWKFFFYFIVGLSSVVVLFFSSLISVFNLSAILSLYEKSSLQSGSANILLSFYKYFVEFFVFSICIFGVACFFYLYQNSSLKLNKKMKMFWLLILLSVITVSYFNFPLLNYNSQKVFSYSSNLKFIVPVFVFFPIFFTFYHQDKQRVLILSVVLCGLAQVLGTNTGLFLKLCFGCLLLIPMAVIYVYDYRDIEKNKLFKGKKLFFVTSLYLILGLSILTRFGWIYHVESGINARAKCLDKINHPKMMGVLTNYRNAKIIENSLVLNKLKQEKLLVYGHQPLLYYLSDKQPAITPYWLKNNLVGLSQLFKKLNSLEKLPIIIDTKENIFGYKGQSKLQQFLVLNNYILKNKSNYGDIWVPDISKFIIRRN